MREDDLTTIFEDIDWIKGIFFDGESIDEPKKGYRNLAYVPYVEFVCEHDYTEHDSSSRMRRMIANGRLVVHRGRTPPGIWPMKNHLETIFKSQDLFHLEIGPTEEFSPRLWQIPLTITYWETVDKS